MDFFASQELARRKTRWMVFWLGVALICMIASIYVVVVLVINLSDTSDASDTGSWRVAWFDPLLLAGVAVGVILLVGIGSLIKVINLRGGGASVAAMLGGRLIPPNSADPAERRILNVVEEMALAAGTAVPPVYVLDHEPGINAFAAGHTTHDAVIGINRGTLEQLNRDELQGVVAHEFSHILNGDMRMSIRMIGLLFGIQLLTLVGIYVLRGSAVSGGRSSNNKGAGAIMAIALALVVVGGVGMFFARLIKASVSRQREYLADASAVQFTRNPGGIAGALKMIAVSGEGSTVHASHAEETSHMFFSSMYPVNRTRMFATHPPLPDRIRKVEPQFDGDFDEYRKKRDRRRKQREEAGQASPPKRGQFPRFGRPDQPGVLGDRFPIDPLVLVAGIGLPEDDHVEYSGELLNRIPQPLVEAARDLFSARCLVFAALVNDHPEVRQRQLDIIAKNEGKHTFEETGRLLPDLEKLEPRYRLPLFEILRGSLTGMSPEQYDLFRNSVDALVAADHKIDLFEFFLRHHLIVHLDRRFGRKPPPRVVYRTLDRLQKEICMLLAVVVQAGHETRVDAKQAFHNALEALGVKWAARADLVEQDPDYRFLEAALDRLNAASPAIKKQVLTAAATAITHDNQVTVTEAELFRAIAESLDCPVPPVVATVDEEDGTTSLDGQA